MEKSSRDQLYAMEAYKKNSNDTLQKRIVDMKVYTEDNIEDNSDVSAKNTILSIYKHKESVYNKILFLARELISRAKKHDNSKLKSPELDHLIEMDKEKKYPYGSPEYFEKMKKWKPFFDHHYNVKENRHHPDHFVNGVNDMTLIDLCEYMIDVISYFDDLNFTQAIDTINSQQERFGFSDQIAYIMKNTLVEYYAAFGNDTSLYKKYVNHYLNKDKNIVDKDDILIDESGLF